MPPKNSNIDIKVFGSRIKGTVKQVAQKLQMTQTNAKKAIRKLYKDIVFYDRESGQYITIDKVYTTPRLMRQFLEINRFTQPMKNKILLNDKVEKFNDEFEIRPKNIAFETTDNLINRITLNVRIVYSDTNGTLERGSDRSCFIRQNIEGGELIEVRPKYPKEKKTKTKDTDKDTGLYYSTAGELKELNYKHLIVYNTMNPNFRYYINTTKMTEKRLEKGTFYRIWDDQKKNIRNPDMQLLKYNEQSQITKDILDKMYKRYVQEGGATFCILEDLSINGSVNQNNRYNETTMKMFNASNISNISINLYNEIIDVKNDDKNCVIATLQKMYKGQINVESYFLKHSPDYMTKGIDTEEVYKFAVKWGLKMICYGIDGTIKKSYFPEKLSKRKVLCYIQYNNHMYLIKNNVLNKKKHFDIKNELKTEDELNEMFYDLLSKQIIPSDIKMAKISKKNKPVVYSFIHEDIMYFSNTDYKLCEHILELFGVKQLMTPFINKYNLIQTLEQLYGIKNTKSFFPQLADIDFNIVSYKSEYFQNLTDEQIESLNPMIIDKSKAYGHALGKLDKILSVDIRQMPKKLYKDEPIELTNVYYIVPTCHTFLIPNAIYASGEDIMYYKEHDISFTIIHYYDANHQQNPYKQLIHDFYTKTQHITEKKTSDEIKRIMNIFIGKLEHVDKTYNRINVNKICNSNEAMLSNGMNTQLDDTNHLIWNEEKGISKSSIYTGKLTKCLIMNMHRRIIFNKMLSMHISENRLIHLKTDAICFIPIEEDEHLYTTESNDYRGWKIEKYKPYETDNDYVLNDYNLPLTRLNKNILYNCYAGTGKSYLVKNEIIKQAIQQGKSYLVLTPSHSSISEYRLEGYNNQVIQTYEYTDKLPLDIDILVIDELGLCNKQAHNFMYMYMVASPNGQIIALGDWNQLLPVLDLHCDMPDYLNMMFPRKRQLDINHRNNFTIKYYDSLINETINLSKEIKKHNTPMDEAEYIILPTNTQIDIMNAYLLEKNGLTMYSEGLEVICKSNKLRNHDIYNNFKLTFDTMDIDDNVYLHDETNEYKITKKQYDAYFKYSKCRTLYNCQGMSIKSYHVPDEHIKYFASSGRYAYTLISRLKQEIIKPIVKKQKVEVSKKIDMTNINFDEL